MLVILLPYKPGINIEPSVSYLPCVAIISLSLSIQCHYCSLGHARGTDAQTKYLGNYFAASSRLHKTSKTPECSPPESPKTRKPPYRMCAHLTSAAQRARNLFSVFKRQSSILGLSRPRQTFSSMGIGMAQKPTIDLQKGWPNPELIPIQQMYEGTSGVLLDQIMAKEALQYQPLRGYQPLLDSLARMLSSFYQSHCQPINPERLMVTGGASPGFVNIIQKFSDPQWTRAIWMVAPTYFLACRMLEDAGFRGKLHAVPEDEEGICTKELERMLQKSESRSDSQTKVYTLVEHSPRML